MRRIAARETSGVRPQRPSEAMIEARGLRRSFRVKNATVEAVRGVTLRVEPGEIVGFLGPNGAGKTTTLRMLTTLLNPTAGQAKVAGYDLAHQPGQVRRRIGYVAQAGGADPGCRVREELVMQGRLYRLDQASAVRRADELCEQLDLRGLEDRLVKTLSGGQRRRLDIALGLVHQPGLVFLDEPTTGLDPQSRSNMWGHIRRVRQDLGTTVFLTTHYLDEADTLCDRIMIIDQGRIVAEGTPEQLKQRVTGDAVTATVTGDPFAAQFALTPDVIQAAEIRNVVIKGRTIRITVDRGDEALLILMRAFEAAGVRLSRIHMVQSTLDDVFLTLTGRSLREDGNNTSPAPTPAG